MLKNTLLIYRFTDQMASLKHRQQAFDTISRHTNAWSTGLESMRDLKLLITVFAESLILYTGEQLFCTVSAKFFACWLILICFRRSDNIIQNIIQDNLIKSGWWG